MNGLSAAVITNMRMLRKARGWTMKTLAEQLAARGYGSMTEATIANMESRPGSRAVTVEKLWALADVFNTTPERLVAAASLCETCHGAPPPGFICASCQRGEEAQ